MIRPTRRSVRLPTGRATLPGLMSNGTRPAVLTTELLSRDGPFRRAADDFLASVCTRCGRPVERDGMPLGDGYFCTPCWSVLTLVR